jgi:hypothetical protein
MAQVSLIPTIRAGSSSSDDASDCSGDELNDLECSAELPLLLSDHNRPQSYPIMPRAEGFTVHPGDRENPELPADIETMLVTLFNSRESPRAPAVHLLLLAKYGSFLIWRLRLREQRIKQWQSHYNSSLKAKARSALAAQVTTESACTSARAMQAITDRELAALKMPELKTKFIELGGTPQHLLRAGGTNKTHYSSAILAIIATKAATESDAPADGKAHGDETGNQGLILPGGESPSADPTPSNPPAPHGRTKRGKTASPTSTPKRKRPTTEAVGIRL